MSSKNNFNQMKNNIFLFAFVLFFSIAKSQVGVNTPNPQGVFNIDGGKDNPKTGNAHTDAQQQNDVTVLANGNVGIGTINPTNKLHIRTTGVAGTPVPGFKLTDGNQGAQKLLMSTTGTGVGTWQTLNAAKNLVFGDFSSAASLSSDNAGSYKYSQVKITLSPGVWIVNLGFTINYNTSGAPAGTYENPYWLHASLYSSSTATTRTNLQMLGPAGNNTGYASVIAKTSNTSSPNFLSGSMVIKVLGTADLPIYVWIENKSLVAPATGGAMWQFDTTSPENYLYAIPVNE